MKEIVKIKTVKEYELAIKMLINSKFNDESQNFKDSMLSLLMVSFENGITFNQKQIVEVEVDG